MVWKMVLSLNIPGEDICLASCRMVSGSPVSGNVMAKPRVWGDSAERVPANLLPAPGSVVGLLGEG